MRRERKTSLFLVLACCSGALGAETDVSFVRGGENVVFERPEQAELAGAAAYLRSVRRRWGERLMVAFS